MYGELSSPPTAPNTTYILHAKWTAKQALEWVDHIPYRLVIITNKAPKTKDDRVIIHKSLNPKVDDKDRCIQALFRYSNRERVFSDLPKVPIPLVLAWVRRNRPHDIQLWEDLAEATYMLPDKYIYAMLSFGIKPSSNRIEWPKKNKTQDSPPIGYRESDIYVNKIMEIESEEMVWI